MLWWTIAGCYWSSFDDPDCVHRDLDDWCFHVPGERGPVVPLFGFGWCPVPSKEPGFRCGDYDVDVNGGGFASQAFVFDAETAELVAVLYTADVNTYCGGFSYWYGRRIDDCEPSCTYGPGGDELPACD